MAFLDNSGDIILDAVLTDTGRLRLAQGDGSFKITKFALGDDEINYGNYNKEHTSGSAYYDLEILQTPVLEAFTNNTSNLNTKLMSISRTNILFMPELLLNKRTDGAGTAASKWQNHDSYMYERTGKGTDVGSGQAAAYKNNKFVVAVDSTTMGVLNSSGNNTGKENPRVQGAILGYKPAGAGIGVSGGLIRVDQGMRTNAINPAAGIDNDLRETQFLVELDYRLGRIAHPNSHGTSEVNFIDDDNVASYYIASNAAGYVNPNTNTDTFNDAQNGTATSEKDPQVFSGSRGNSLVFRIRASTELQYSTYLFNQLGQELSPTDLNTQLGIEESALTDSSFAGADAKAYVLDTTVRVIGMNTGFRMDIPIRYLKIE